MIWIFWPEIQVHIRVSNKLSNQFDILYEDTVFFKEGNIVILFGSSTCTGEINYEHMEQSVISVFKRHLEYIFETSIVMEKWEEGM